MDPSGLTCPACVEAEANPWTGRVRTGCKDCTARLWARGTWFHEARRTGEVSSEYRAELEARFGEADADKGHRRAVWWHRRMAAARSQT